MAGGLLRSTLMSTITIGQYTITQDGNKIIVENGARVELQDPGLGELIEALILINQGEPPKLMTTRVFADHVGKSQNAVLNAVRRGKIPGTMYATTVCLIPASAAERIDWGGPGNPGIARLNAGSGTNNRDGRKAKRSKP